MEIEVYWRPGCPFCMALAPRLRRSGLPRREINIWEDPEGAARVREVAGGNETVPTVIVGERALVNPGISEINEAVRAEAPELLQQAEQARQPRKRPWRWFRR